MPPRPTVTPGRQLRASAPSVALPSRSGWTRPRRRLQDPACPLVGSPARTRPYCQREWAGRSPAQTRRAKSAAQPGGREEALRQKSVPRPETTPRPSLATLPHRAARRTKVAMTARRPPRQACLRTRRRGGNRRPKMRRVRRPMPQHAAVLRLLAPLLPSGTRRIPASRPPQRVSPSQRGPCPQHLSTSRRHRRRCLEFRLRHCKWLAAQLLRQVCRPSGSSARRAPSSTNASGECAEMPQPGRLGTRTAATMTSLQTLGCPPAGGMPRRLTA
mmetsp:Transcript_38689/g.102172  ORF Transcript_38689/g.102172 Transcript_38689/m.102172 type:complete len:273 (-) Transcript_38689:896-1714(-)